MQYMGGKFRIRKPVSNYLNSIREYGQPYWEPFVGAAWILEQIDKKRLDYASDINPYLIAMWGALQDGWEPPVVVTEEEYLSIKENPRGYPPELVAFVGFGCSWGGKWFGGYARGAKGRNYALNARNSVIRQISKLTNVRFFAGDFFEVTTPERKMLIYCDPPYAATTGYDAVEGKWDVEKFWTKVRWLKEHGHTVVVSEYNAPDDFSCVLEIPTRTDMRSINGLNPRIEKLFRIKPNR